LDFKKTLSKTPGLIEKLANLEHDPFPETPILFAKLKPLWQCNLSCAFCELPPAGKPMTKEKVIEILRALLNRGLLKIHYSGGEVFLHPEVFPILEESCALGIQVNLTTNGTLLDRQKVRILSKMGVHSVSISLDAAESTLHDRLRGKKGAFKAALKTIQLIANNKKKRPKLRVNTVVTRENVHQLDKIHELLSSISKTIHWKIMPVDSIQPELRLDREMVRALSEQTKHWELLDEQPFGVHQLREGRFEKDHTSIVKGKYGKRYYDDHRCYMPWLHIFIDPGGFVYPCCMSRGRIPAFGNVYDNPIDKILGNSMRREFRMNMASDYTIDVCRYCDDFIRENAMIDEVIQ